MVASRLLALLGAAVLLVGAPAPAQVPQADPYAPPAYAPPPPPPPPYEPGAPSYQPVDPSYVAPTDAQDAPIPIEPAPLPSEMPEPPYPLPNAAPPSAPGQTTAEAGIPKDDVMTAAEGVFGKGAEGLGGLVEKIFKDRGQPVAYIAGREAGGAFVVGVRYGSGMMRHKIEGDRKVYWNGPSIGFDAGADANKVFVLVYNLHDSQELFRRYPTAEGRAYLVGGFSASVLKRGDVVLVPVRLGVGMRLGVNAGYMNFSEKSRWLPF